MNNIFTQLSAALLKKRKKMVQPDTIQPMLATLTDSYFSDKNWFYEHKFDGERCIAFKKNGKVRLLSRNDIVKNNTYPELVAALEKQKADNFIIDGEIVARDQSGISDFQKLQSRINVQQTEKIALLERTVQIDYCMFDLMYVDGYDIRNLPLYARKELLHDLFTYTPPLIYTEHIVKDGLPYFKKACSLHWEGLIAKRADSTYEGRRSQDWLKFKCIMQQELVIGGYTAPKGNRSYFGALLVGYYQNGKLIYAGKVGTGYSESVLEMLGKKLQKLEIKKCPFESFDETTSDVHWVKPELVAEFQFAQWTKSGKLRVGRYKGLRDDKDAKSVVREIAKPIAHITKK